MIKVKHPLEKYRQDQEAFLASCPPEERRYHELLFSYGNATYHYHQEAQDHAPTETDYQEWLEGLPPAMQPKMREKGFEECRTLLPFTRYVMEKNDVGMEAYVRELMGEEAYAAFKSMVAASQ